MKYEHVWSVLLKATHCRMSSNVINKKCSTTLEFATLLPCSLLDGLTTTSMLSADVEAIPYAYRLNVVLFLKVATGRLRSAATVGNWRRKNAQIDQNADRSPLSSNWSRSNASALMSAVFRRRWTQARSCRLASSGN